jgi:hypothetical protein
MMDYTPVLSKDDLGRVALSKLKHEARSSCRYDENLPPIPNKNEIGEKLQEPMSKGVRILEESATIAKLQNAIALMVQLEGSEDEINSKRKQLLEFLFKN